ncbi:Glu-tRNA(Gln) amidotransferase subunit GatD [Pyrobaculum neutrophilum]|uniref:Glutamyl-tRNA(Gln) amidotransferase subunit D n=1 Tax=Pyrobaculum neutrophilum (strain DSM 2338 / JCM 9278 / NBRC 100436 / V24Sta) TaxID=444157 RepID=B1YAN7_PYRNV|nr:Glu-tRNA(Gln) amidotransferase subunit GatD [Pyrobaculum neutrophilum]ACB39116.1 glutamyl-tRNA(Gln) amidotransferase, subunit D [Pyrobaculum neutrophilum V24Sta]
MYKRVRVVLENGDVFEGVLIPPTQFSDPDVVVLKLRNGYNVGLRKSRIKEMVDLGEVSGGQPAPPQIPKLEGEKVWLLATGGTILSRVDYVTGGVYPTMSVEYLFEILGGLDAPVVAEQVAAKFSEDMTPAVWSQIAARVGEAFRRGARGVVVLHGTDTMHYTAAALAFAFRSAPGPIALVGAQRSSDRPSTDAVLNLKAAIATAARAPFAESVVVMHKASGDGVIAVHRGTRVRKMHTSRRDAFQSINALPLAEYHVDQNLLKVIAEEYRERGALEYTDRFEEAVALVKFFPGMHPRMLDVLLEMGVKGVVIEGTGFGHVGEQLLPSVKRLVDAGVVVAMASQTLYGRVNLYVYRRGRELLSLGVVPLEDMLPEAAYAKMSWALANFKREEVPRVLTTPYAYEMSPRSDPTSFGTL